MSIRLLPVSPGFQAAQSCDLSPSFCSTGLIMWRGNIVGGGGDCCWNTALSMLLHRPEDITTMRPELWTLLNVTSTFYLLRNTCDCSSPRDYKFFVVIHFITCFKCLFMIAIYFRRVWKASWKKLHPLFKFISASFTASACHMISVNAFGFWGRPCLLNQEKQ